MARKTYHHLRMGDHVVVETMSWDPGEGECIEEQVTGKVTWVGKSRVKVLHLVQGGRFTSESSFSMQGGQEWGSSAGISWVRLSPAHARKKGAPLKPYESPACLPSADEITQAYEVYPGQPLVSAACIVAVFASPEEAFLPHVSTDGTTPGWYEAESRREIPGAGGQASMAVDILLGYRKHKSIDRVITELHEGWNRTVNPSNFPDRYEPGMVKARALEPLLREALAEWFA